MTHWQILSSGTVPLAFGGGEVDVDVYRGLVDVGRKGREGMQAEDGAQTGLVDDRIA